MSKGYASLDKVYGLDPYEDEQIFSKISKAESAEKFAWTFGIGMWREYSS